MKTHSILMSLLLMTGTGLWARIAIQGLEPALVTATVEWLLKGADRARGGSHGA